MKNNTISLQTRILRSLFLLLGLIFVYLNPVYGQNCYVRLSDVSGMTPTQGQLDSLEYAACRLRDSLPAEFQSAFKVYDFGFYLHNETMAGGYPEAFQKAIDLAQAGSPYYLLFGKQTDKNGVYTRFWVKLKLPTNAQFSCMTQIQREVYHLRVEKATVKNFKSNKNEYLQYYKAEIAGIQELYKIVGEIKDCCIANKGGVVQRSAGCSGCNDEILNEYFEIQNFNKTKLRTAIATTSELETNFIKESSNVKLKVGTENKLVSSLFTDYVTKLNDYIGFKLLITSHNAVCLKNLDTLKTFKNQSEFACWIDFDDFSVDSSNVLVNITWQSEKKSFVKSQEQADKILNIMYCYVFNILGVAGYNCGDNFGDNIQYNFYAPPTKPDTKDVAWFIQEIRKEEDKMGADSTNTPLLISKIRKIFYNSDAWDLYLIKGAKDVPPFYSTVRIPYPGYPKFWPTGGGVILAGDHIGNTKSGFLITDIENRPIDNAGNTPLIYWNNNQEVKLSCCPGNIVVDLGHVLAGLDAQLHEQQVSVPFEFPVSINSNVTAVTWVGDIGSAVAETQYEIDYLADLMGKFPSASEEQEVLDRLAPPADLIGNIDAYVIAAMYPSIYQGGKRLSDILYDYYIGPGQNNQNRRFHIYAERLGLGWNGEEFLNLSSKISAFRNDIKSSAVLFVAIGIKNSSSNLPVALFKIGVYASMTLTGLLTNNVSASNHLGKYFNTLKNLVKQEN